MPTAIRVSLGEHVSDDDLVALRDGYRKVIEALSPFGERYELVRWDAALKAERITSFIRARGIEQA